MAYVPIKSVYSFFIGLKVFQFKRMNTCLRQAKEKSLIADKDESLSNKSFKENYSEFVIVLSISSNISGKSTVSINVF